jgi:hypothetical protein
MPTRSLVIVNGRHACCFSKREETLRDEIVRSPSEAARAKHRLPGSVNQCGGTDGCGAPLRLPYHRRQRVDFAAPLFDRFVECCLLFVGLLFLLLGQVSLLLGVWFLVQTDA